MNKTDIEAFSEACYLSHSRNKAAVVIYAAAAADNARNYKSRADCDDNDSSCDHDIQLCHILNAVFISRL